MIRSLVGAMLFLLAVSCGGGGRESGARAGAVPPAPAASAAPARPGPLSPPSEASAPTGPASSNPPEAARTAPASSSAPTDAPAPTPNASGSRCRGATLKLEDIFIDECVLADLPAASEKPPSIALEIVAKDSFIQGGRGTVSVAFVNRSGKEVDMIFEHRCLADKASHMFDLEVTNGRGASAMLELHRPPVGMIGALKVDCPKPYVGAKVLAGGRVTIDIPFDLSAVAQLGPGLPPGELSPGVYSVEVTTPLARRPFLKGKFRLNVKPL